MGRPTELTAVFAGTPDFAVPSLQTLIDDDAVELRGVYTQPDRPAGRGRKLRESPVKRLALDAGIEVFQPEHLKDIATRASFVALGADVLVVAAYGLILPTAILDAVRYPVNVHASLLPRWRGAAPIQRAILAGDDTTGISIMRIVAALDAGPVWVRRACAISNDDTGGSLHDKLALLGAEALLEALALIRHGAIDEQAQDESLVTYADKITAADRQIDWAGSAHDIARRVRALSPLPGARAEIGGLDTKLLRARAVDEPANASPGAILPGFTDGIGIASGNGILAIDELQVAGRKRMSASAFRNGHGELF